MDGFSFKFYQGKPFLDVKSSRTNHGFITETPLNIILEQKMSSDKNNPSINYKKNLKNTIRFSKRFHASTINRTENEISSLDENRSSLKFFDGKQNDEIESNNFDIKQKIKKSNVLSNLNPFFLTKTQEINSQTYNYSPQKKLLNYKKTKRPETDFKKNILKRLYLNKNSLSDLIKLRFPITTDNAKRKIEEKLFRRSGINSIVVDGETPSINKEKDLQNKFPSSSPKENESQQMLKLDLNLERTFTNIEENNSPLVSSPLLMTFAEEFKDLTKLELRKKLFRKYSLKKKEKRPIIQNPILEEENFRKTNGETIDFENFINKRKEFEVYYEDELFKTGYFNETNNTDFLDLKQEKKSGLIQRNINGTKKGLPNNKEEIVKGTHKLYEKYFREKDIKENNNSPSHKIQNNESFLRAHENILTIKEMEIIDQEFKKSDPDFEIIDKNLQVLKFFSRFDKNTRMNLLKHSSLRKFACTEIIFNQGDYGNYMYVVLQGAVNIRKSYKTKSNQLQNTVINTLYDGETFGELALMGTTEKKEQDVKDLIKKNNKNEQECEKQKKSQKKVYIERTKRMATTQAAETTYVLAISREYFKKILLGSSQKELDDKLNFLINMPGFSVFEPHSLIPLANNFKTCYFGTGEIILKEGEKPECLYILKQGSCRLVKNQFVKRDLCPSIYSKGLRKALPNLNFGALKNKEIIKKKKKLIDENRNSRILFVEPKILEKEEKIQYNDMIEYGTLAEGDIIGQRAIFNMQNVNQNDFTIPKLFDVLESKISVIADSNMVELLKLERKSLEFIPEFLKIALKKEIQNTFECDENINIDDDMEVNEIWYKFKEKYVKQIIKCDALNKNSKNFYKIY